MSQHSTKKQVQSQPGSVAIHSFSGIYPVWKNRGETLAVLLERFRIEHGLEAATKLTYAGRLDPMAEGLVLVLAGRARFQKDTLLGLTKVYEVDVLLGVATDTGDALGHVTAAAFQYVSEDRIAQEVSALKEITTLPYPMYSSVPVDGIPLFVHARTGTVVEVPHKKVTIYSAELMSLQSDTFGSIATASVSDIQKVVGDFRQDAIIADWQSLTARYADTPVMIVTIRIEASSGTYMRTLAALLGERLGVPALAYRIVRRSVGEYSIKKEI